MSQSFSPLLFATPYSPSTLVQTLTLDKTKPGPVLQIDAQGIRLDGIAPQQHLWQHDALHFLVILAGTVSPQFAGYGWYLSAALLLVIGGISHWLMHARWRNTSIWLLTQQGAGVNQQWLLNLACRDEALACASTADIAAVQLTGASNDRCLRLLLRSGEVREQKLVQWIGEKWVDLEPAVLSWLDLVQAQRTAAGLEPIQTDIRPASTTVPPSKPRPLQSVYRNEQGIYRPSANEAHPTPRAYIDQQRLPARLPSFRFYMLLALAVMAVGWLTPVAGPLMKAWSPWPLLAMVVLLVAIGCYGVVRRKQVSHLLGERGLPLAQCKDGVLLLQLDFNPDAKRLAVQTSQVQSVQLMRIPRMPFGRIIVRMHSGLELQQKIDGPLLRPESDARQWLAPALQSWLGKERVHVEERWSTW